MDSNYKAISNALWGRREVGGMTEGSAASTYGYCVNALSEMLNRN